MSRSIVSKKSGFTLIELLVVIAIISMLASIVLSATFNARARGRDGQRVAALRQVRLAVEVYYSIHGEYPPLHSIDIVQNWSDLITLLQTEKLIGKVDTAPSHDFASALEHALASLNPIQTANAIAPLNTSIQDPLYPARTYSYMVGDTAKPYQNFRLRAQLEDKSNPVFQNAITGKFLFYDESADPNDPDYYADGYDDECAPAYGYYCLGPQQIADVNYNAFDPGKPVIYLYPIATTSVSVRISPARIDVSEPAYNGGWNVIAHPNGSILNPADGQTYPYLYWEGGSTEPTTDLSHGFVIPTAQVRSFLADALARQGLTSTEASDFIDYWAPRLTTDKPYVYIYFMPKTDYDALVPMIIVPKPDTLIRLYMLWKPLDHVIPVIPETLTAPKRDGFTAVEWGGDRTPLK